MCYRYGYYSSLGRIIEFLESQKTMNENILRLPCTVGDEVYILTECEKIHPILDGTLWDENGVFGTATGYYCPYDNEEFIDCNTFQKKTAIYIYIKILLMKLALLNMG